MIGETVVANPLYTLTKFRIRAWQTRLQEGTVMQTIGSVLKSVDHEIHLGWQHIRSWAETLSTRERTTEILFLSLTLTLCALVLFCLNKAVQYSIVMRL